MEGTMTEFADIFAYGMTTTVFLTSSIAMLMAFTAAALWAGRKPVPSAAFAPARGL